MDLSLERKLFFNFDPAGWRYWREGTPPAGAALMAFTVDERGRFCRQFWAWPMNAWIDGAEAPLPQPECRLVSPATIKLNVSANSYISENARLSSKPTRLAERWTAWHNSRPRVVHYESWLETIKRLFR